MKILSVILFIFLSFCVRAQTGDMRVYTVAGSLTATTLGDGGPATAASLSATEGIWMDNNCNLYISDMGHSRIRKITSSDGIITTIAGNGISGYSGDNGLATNAEIKTPYGLYADKYGNVFFSEYSSNSVRRIDALTGKITLFAGHGSTLGDGGPATAAQLNNPHNVYGDSLGNIYIAEVGRIRKVDASNGIISTIAGSGIPGLSGDDGPATAAQISDGVAGMVFDKFGNLIFADRSNSRVRKINRITGIITTVAGTTGGYYSGDGGPATNAQMTGPIGLAIDENENIIIADNGNDYIRKVDAVTGIISTIAGVGSSGGSTVEGALSNDAQMHPEFLYLDRHGNIYYSNYGNQIHKITNYLPGLEISGSRCGPPSRLPLAGIKNDILIYPNPTADKLNIINDQYYGKARLTIANPIGQQLIQCNTNDSFFTLDIAALLPGVYILTLVGENIYIRERILKTK